MKSHWIWIGCGGKSIIFYMDDPYYSFNAFLRSKFGGEKVLKIPINGGFNCPNKDGTKSDRGCVFCDAYGSGPIGTFDLPVQDQIESVIGRHQGRKFIAYFQAHSNTYGSKAELETAYEIVFDYPEIVGLFIGTRPDSIADEVYSLLERLNQRIYLSVELGLQTIHPAGLDFLNRNHTYGEFLSAFENLKDRGIDVVVHLIVGIPGETRRDMLRTVAEMNRLKPAGIKFHLMHVLKGSPLYDLYKKEPFPLLEFEAYVDLMIQLLENLDPAIVIHRLTGERDREIFFEPRWALDKIRVIQAIQEGLRKRKSRQGIRLANK